MTPRCPRRPAALPSHRGRDVETLPGDATKAREKLAWKPEMLFPEPVGMTVRSDLEQTRRLVDGIGRNGCKDSGEREG